MPTNARSSLSTTTRASVTVGKSGFANSPLKRASVTTLRTSS